MKAIVIRWKPEDVRTLRPDWTLNRCEEELDRIGGQLQDRSIELGWQVMEDLLD